MIVNVVRVNRSLSVVRVKDMSGVRKTIIHASWEVSKTQNKIPFWHDIECLQSVPLP